MQVYLDYAASTPLKKEVLEEMIPYMTDTFGNASSIHSFGREMHKGLDKSRRTLAKLMGASYDEFYFTAGGTESDNWALKGVAESYCDKGKHIIISEFEHPAVLNAAKALEKKGFEVTYVKPDRLGHINPEDVKQAIQEDTILVSIMYINNEIGTIQDVKAIGSICRNNDIIFHTDAVQAFGYLPIYVKEMNIDMMSVSAHKIYGPIGIGGLYIRKGIKIKPLIDGGAQERKRRAGTSNVPGAVGFSKAALLRYDNLNEIVLELEKKRDYLYERLKPLDITLNGSENRHPGSLNILFNGIKGDTLLMNLDLAGIAVSSGSACSSGSVNPSHVLLSIGLSTQEAKASLRMTVGDNTSYEELDFVIVKMTEIIKRLR